MKEKVISCAFLLISQGWFVMATMAQVDVRSQKPTALNPLPNTTKPINAAKGYLLTQIKNNIYCVTDGIYQMMFILTGKGVVVVDAPPSIGANILLAIREVTSEPITHVIYSHSHPDHIGAANLYPQGAMYITGDQAAAELQRHNTATGMIAFGAFTGGKPVPSPTKTFTDSMTLTIGDKVIRLLHIKAAAHSADDIIVYLPEEKIAMMVDIVFPGWIPFEQVAYAVDIDGYLDIQRYLLSLDFEILVGGHWSKLGSRTDVVNNIAYINDLLQGLSVAFRRVEFKRIAEKTGTANINLLMEAYFDAVAKYAADNVEEKWKTILSGCDVWTYSHARRLLSFVRDSQVSFMP